jgi:hypothetical protein
MNDQNRNNKLLNTRFNTVLRGYQASTRGGLVNTSMYKNKVGELRVELIGNAVTSLISKII